MYKIVLSLSNNQKQIIMKNLNEIRDCLEKQQGLLNVIYELEMRIKYGLDAMRMYKNLGFTRQYERQRINNACRHAAIDRLLNRFKDLNNQNSKLFN